MRYVKPRDIPSICSLNSGRKPKVVFGIPIPKGQAPHPKTVQSLIDSVPLIEAAGFDHGYTQTTGNPYISGARAEITRKGMDAKADIMVYLDYDVAWKPQDLIDLLKAEGDVVAGTYRCKTDDPNEELYMGCPFTTPDGHIETIRADGAIKAKVVPAGFLKVTTTAIDLFMRAYPELCYGPQFSLSVDLFQHGAHDGLWWGEDYAFCRNYNDCGGSVWLLPNLDLDHWGSWVCPQCSRTNVQNAMSCECKYQRQWEGVFRGNYHEFMLRQPGGSKDPKLQEVA